MSDQKNNTMHNPDAVKKIPTVDWLTLKTTVTSFLRIFVMRLQNAGFLS